MRAKAGLFDLFSLSFFNPTNDCGRRIKYTARPASSLWTAPDPSPLSVFTFSARDRFDLANLHLNNRSTFRPSLFFFFLLRPSSLFPFYSFLTSFQMPFFFTSPPADVIKMLSAWYLSNKLRLPCRLLQLCSSCFTTCTFPRALPLPRVDPFFFAVPFGLPLPDFDCSGLSFLCSSSPTFFAPPRSSPVSSSGSWFSFSSWSPSTGATSL